LLIGWTDFDGSSLRKMPAEAFAARASDSLKAVYANEGKTGADLGYQMYTDQHVGAPARWVADKASDGAPSYLYLFTHVRPENRGKVRGAAHGDELPFVFDAWSRAFPRVQLTEEDRAVTRMMQSCWVSFAKTGTPSCEGAPDWPRYRRTSDQLMELGAEPKVLTGFRREQLDAQEAAMQSVIGADRSAVEQMIGRMRSGEFDMAD
jgi:para-nitrobenzyl esterase